MLQAAWGVRTTSCGMASVAPNEPTCADPADSQCQYEYGELLKPHCSRREELNRGLHLLHHMCSNKRVRKVCPAFL